MKEYLINSDIFGRWFDFRLCAKSFKEAAERIGTTQYHLKTYGTFRKIDTPYKEVYVTPYCHKAKEACGRKEITYEQAKKTIDKQVDEFRIKMGWTRS